MSGRGRGQLYRGRNNGGRGRNPSTPRSSPRSDTIKSTSYKPAKKTLADSIYYLGSAKQAADYETTTEFLINHIQKTYNFGNDIGTALEELTVFDINSVKPTRYISQEDDLEIRESENETFNIEYKAEFDVFLKRKQHYETNTTKAYAFLWEQCAKGMQSKIESHSNFKKLIKGNPIELLKVIKQHCLNYHENRYEMSIILDALKSFINLKQKDGELLQDYTKRFKTSRDVLRSHLGGPIMLTKTVTNMKDYNKMDEDTIETCYEKTFNQFLAYTYLENSDKTKYGSLLTGLQTQQSLKNNQYPQSVTEANNVLSNHKFDTPTIKPKLNKTSNYSDNDKESKNNNKEEMPEMSFAMMEGKCYCCGKGGHKSPTCRLKDKIPKDEWAINKAKTKEQSHVNTESSAKSPEKSTAEKSGEGGWCGTHVQFYQATEMKNWILLDNGSTVNLFCNPDLVENITKSSEMLELSTNGGELFTNLKATVPGFGEVWYDPDAITNIFSFSELEKKYKITYDTTKEKAFIVHLPNKNVKFIKSSNGLYYYKPKYSTSTKNNMSLLNHSVESVEENKKQFTNRQFQQAKLTRQIYHALGTPSINDFKSIILSNQIKNLPITIEDVNIAENIFGTDIGALKGKTTRQKPAPVVSDYIEIPQELINNHNNVTLCMDGIKINGIYFISTISRNIMYRTTECVPDKTMQSYRSVLDNVFRVYNTAGFKITTILCDNEFQPLMNELQDVYNITVNYANPQEHVPEAERNNRVIKERFRSAFHRLPFSKIPKIMVKVLAMECAKKLNFFPPKGGISPYYSPRMILHQKALDYNKHCSIPFGSYVQAHNEPNIKNTQHPRTLDCIYLRYTDNSQGGHHLLDLRTGSTIKRRSVTTIPITKNVIDLVHDMANKDNIKDGLKIETKSGKILYDSAWIAGVDYIENNFDDEKSVDNENEIIDIDEMNPNEILENEIKNNEDQQNDFEEVTVYSNPSENESIEEEIEDQFENENLNENESFEEITVVEGSDIEEYDKELYDFEVTKTQQITKSGREIKAPDRYGFYQENGTWLSKCQNSSKKFGNRLSKCEKSKIANIVQPTGTVPVTAQYDNLLAPDKKSYIKNNDSIRASAPDHLLTQGFRASSYSSENAPMIAKIMHHYNNMVKTKECKKYYAFLETFSLKKGLQKFGKKGYDAAFGEIEQLHNRAVFQPIYVNKLTQQEKKRAMESLIFLVEKRDGRVKARACANGSTQRDYINKDDAASPTAAIESILLTAAIDAKEKRDVMTADIPNAFVQTDMVNDSNEKIIMKIRGQLVDMLVALDPELYTPYISSESSEKIIYVELLKALYGTLQAALLFYKKLKKDLEGIGFKINPYDPCVANRTIKNKQHTVTWHVDDLKSSHVDSTVNDEFFKWLEKMYGDSKLAPVKATRGKIHDYLAIKLDYSTANKLKVDMTDYVKGMVTEFPEELSKSNYPWNQNLFQIDNKCKLLNKEKSEIFHTFVAKGLFVCKRARPDIQPAIAFLSTRVKAPDEQDWCKLVKMMNYLNNSKEDVLTLECDELCNITWHLDASFAVHNDKRSHTGATMSLGGGAIISISTKQKINTRSSTEAELVSIDDVIAKVLWTKLFLEAQGYNIEKNVLMRDNISSMKLETNGKMSSGKRTRHFDIKYFYITDLLERKELTIQYCPTDKMIADYMTKPLTGSKFHTFRKKVMNPE
jgi:hypothetical protein